MCFRYGLRDWWLGLPMMAVGSKEDEIDKMIICTVSCPYECNNLYRSQRNIGGDDSSGLSRSRSNYHHA